MIIGREQDVTVAASAVMERTADPRQREIMLSLVKHLHGFVRDVRLTEAEFREATAILAELGKQSTDTHNEVVLMAGSLGVSSLVCLLNNGDQGNTETAQSLLGPFWRLNSPVTENGGSIVRSETPGAALFVTGHVVDRAGHPVAGAEVDVWHASPVGLYENQDPEQAEMNLRGKFATDADGRFAFRSVMMVGYPIPTDGVVGRLLKAQDRHPYRPAHLHALIFKPGFKVLISQVYDPADPHIASDVQFGVTKALIGDFVRHDEPHPPAPEARSIFEQINGVYEKVDDLTEIISKIGRGELSELRIGSVPSISQVMVPRAIERVRRRYPDLRIDINILKIEEAVDYLLLGRGDCVAMSSWIDHSGLDFLPLASGELYCIVPTGHELAGRKQISAREMIRYPLIGIDPNDPYGRIMAEIFARNKLDYDITIRARFGTTVCALVKAGLGIAVIDQFTVAHGGYPGVELLRIVEPTRFDTHIAVKRGAPLSLHIEHFIECLRSEMRAVGPGKTAPRKPDPKPRRK